MIYKLVAKSDGMTSKELAAVLGKPINTFSGRLSELKKSGALTTTGERRDGCEVHVKAGPAEQLNLMLVA